MRKLLSLLIIICTITSNVVFISADTTTDGSPESAQTPIEYSGTGEENYSVTVPASLSPGESGDVTLSGTWAYGKGVKVSVTSKEIELVNDISEADKKTVTVDFNPIVDFGSNTSSNQTTKTISIGDIEGALFGTWTGKVEFEVALGSLDDILLPEDTDTVIYDGDNLDPSINYVEKELTRDADRQYIFDKLTDDKWLIIPAAYFVPDEGEASISEGEKSGTWYKITSIGRAYADNVISFTGLVIPKTVKSIGDVAFSSCCGSDIGLEWVYLSEGVTDIGASCFSLDFFLKEVHIPNTVTDIWGEAFQSTGWLLSNQDEGPFLIINNILVDGATAVGDIVVPDGVTSIGGGAFSSIYLLGRETEITSITLLEGIEDIHMGAFDGCDKLEEITIPKSLREVNGWYNPESKGDYSEYWFSFPGNLKVINYAGSESEFLQIEGMEYILSNIENVTINYNYKY